jgi:ATP-dependent DNA helicase RecQ
MIFSDKTLIDMCAKLPKTRAELLDVHGVGETKMRRYGDEFLTFIRAHANG